MLQDTELDERDNVHVIPEFGPQHQCSEFCWCHPQCINTAMVALGAEYPLYVHNVMH